MLIYLITSKLDNKPYVGKLVREERFNAYWGSGKYIRSAVKLYGRRKFIKVILESGIKNKKLLCKREKYWIKEINSIWPNGYNLTSGGEGDDTFTNNPNKEEIRKKLIAVHKGKPTWNKGLHCWTKKHKKNLSIIGKERGFGKWMTGKHHTETTKAKMKATWARKRLDK